MTGHGGYREGNPTYALTDTERHQLGMLAAMNLWPKAALANAFGVTPKTVLVCLRRYLGELT